ncbi:2,4-dienoyl-CoA reductase [Sporobacter termitidis DSM 10068]|uniref:2,4-dienoyl-CoA reductase n=1 Tax=Sporobacter termitidis DSM 10068 TaxID=1123282 RepID=A0A1M5YBV9_9FIRM|nr:FAD-dependent oxidoreductase [Sporobacter termitidis]SHI09550.1 2,4-dienoyl-CoA reductase [Sporobacter termitidis DSM 10068]
MPSFNNYKHVFTPLRVGGTTLKNRVEFAPMVCDFTDSHGEATQRYIDFVEMQAATGVALIHLGATPVNWDTAPDYPSEIDVTSELKLNHLKLMSEAAHTHNAKLSCELVHAGRGVGAELIKAEWGIAPTSMPIPGKHPYIREMNQKDIEQTVADYAGCANRLYRCGFDGVLIHGAHGNLLAQFLSPMTNHRTDIYGGSFENRCRFPLMVLKAVKEAVGPEFIVELRISGDEILPGGMRINEVIEFLKLAQEHIDLVTVSAGLIVDPNAFFYAMPPYFRPRGVNVPLARQVRQCPDIHIPVSVVGGISVDMAEQIIAEGSADMVAIARAFLADPDMLKKCYRGKPEDVRPCLRCWGCAGAGHVQCAVNPQIGRTERYARVHKADEKKKVVVIGGGVAGTQAARTLAARGHDVVLFEKKDRLGGLLNDIDKLPFKDDLLRHTEWVVNTTMRCGADIRLSTEATPERVLAENPDAIVLAAGARPARPPIPGIDGPNVFNVLDVDAGRKKVSGKIVVCGGGVSGCESALALAMEGGDVTVVDIIPEDGFAAGLSELTRGMLMLLLGEHHVKLLGDHIVRSIDRDGVHIEGRDWKYRTLEADYVVDAMGMKNDPSAAAAYTDLIPDVFVVGDAYGVGNIKSANLSAYNAAMNI